jgi:hypothetical protein
VHVVFVACLLFWHIMMGLCNVVGELVNTGKVIVNFQVSDSFTFLSMIDELTN